MRYHDIYRGIVIQNNDPTNAGRVKVFVPDVNATLIKEWNDDKETDQKFVHLGANTDSSLTPEILQRLKEILPWARVSLPVFGRSTAGMYHNASNTSYIGNDSNLLSQMGNKSEQFFVQDRVKAQTARPPYADPMAKLPRGIIDLAGIEFGNPSFPLECGKSPTIASSAPPAPSGAAGDHIRSLPQSYPALPANNFFDPEIPVTRLNRIQQNSVNIAQGINDAIDSITIDVFNPEIHIKGVKVDLSKTIFNNDCYDVPISGDSLDAELSYEPPITFSDTPLLPIRNTDMVNLPVQLMINGVVANRDFNIVPQKTTPKSIVYSLGDMEVTIPKKNVGGINIAKNNNRTDISKIAALKPFGTEPLESKPNLFQTILPRVASLASMLSAGGGGAAAFNRVNTSLLPQEQRREALIGGNNPISKENRNFGAMDSPENCGPSGANQLSKADNSGPYRPPDHTNNFKGMVSIPAPGAHVHVRFENGDPNMPTVVDTFVPQSDYEAMYSVESANNEASPPDDVKKDKPAPSSPAPIYGPPAPPPTTSTQIYGPPEPHNQIHDQPPAFARDANQIPQPPKSQDTKVEYYRDV